MTTAVILNKGDFVLPTVVGYLAISEDIFSCHDLRWGATGQGCCWVSYNAQDKVPAYNAKSA